MGGRAEEMEEELEAERQARSKAEKQRSDLAKEFEQLGDRLDEAGGATLAQIELNKKRENEIDKLRKDCEEANIQQEAMMMSMKKKIAAENGDLLRVAGDINNNLMMIQKVKASLTANLEEAKSVADNEARERGLLLGKYKNMEFELDGVKEHLDEEVSSREEVGRQIKKAEGEATQWRCKYENDAVAKAEDLEMTKMKLSARLTEAESSIEN